jgi:hypothetical protein
MEQHLPLLISLLQELPRPTESNAKPKETKEDTSHQCPGNLLDALLTYINSAVRTSQLCAYSEKEKKNQPFFRSSKTTY